MAACLSGVVSPASNPTFLQILFAIITKLLCLPLPLQPYIKSEQQ